MKLISDIFERLPQVWVLVGLLIISSGLYLGFDYSIICTVYGLALFVLLLLDGPKRSNTRPLSQGFISVGSTVIMPTPQADQEPPSSH